MFKCIAFRMSGAIDADHLDYYLDEFTFRFNRRRSQARGLLSTAEQN